MPNRKFCLLMTHILSQPESEADWWGQSWNNPDYKFYKTRWGHQPHQFLCHKISQPVIKDQLELAGFHLNLDFRDLSVECHIKQKKKNNSFFLKRHHRFFFLVLQHPPTKREQQYILCISKEICMTSLESVNRLKYHNQGCMNTKAWERDQSEYLLSLNEWVAYAWGHLDMPDALAAKQRKAKQSTFTAHFMN